MNEFLSALKWIIGTIILFVGLYLGVEAYKSGESILSSLGVAGFGVAFLMLASFLGGSPGGGEGIGQQELEHYRSENEECDHGDGWHE
jgi:hypothetical protein